MLSEIYCVIHYLVEVCRYTICGFNSSRRAVKDHLEQKAEGKSIVLLKNATK